MPTQSPMLSHRGRAFGWRRWATCSRTRGGAATEISARTAISADSRAVDEEVDVRQAEDEQDDEHDDRERRCKTEVEDLETLLVEVRRQDVRAVDRPAICHHEDDRERIERDDEVGKRRDQ